MALTNAERQARWREKRNALAKHAEALRNYRQTRRRPGASDEEKQTAFLKAEAAANRSTEANLSTARMQTLMFDSVCRLLAEMTPQTRSRVTRHMEKNYGAEVAPNKKQRKPGITYYSENVGRLGGRVSRAQFEAECPEAREAIARNAEMVASMQRRRG